jgi:MFS family permease
MATLDLSTTSARPTWPTNVLIGMGTMLIYAAIGIATPTLPRWTAVNVSTSGSALGSMAIAYTIGAIGCRPLLAKVGPHASQAQIAIAGALISACGFGLHRIATSIGLLWIARFVVAIGETFAYLGMSNLITSAAGSRAAEAMSYNSASLFAGLGLGPLVGDPWSKAHRWDLAFGVPVVLCLLGALMIVLLGSHAIEPPRALVGASRFGIHRPSIRPGMVLGFLILSEATWQNYLTPYSDSRHIGQVGLRLAVFAFSVLVLRVVLAKVPAAVGMRVTAAFSVAVVSAALVALGVIGGPTGMWISTIGSIIGMAQMFPALIGLTLEREPDPAKHALALSTFTMFFEIGAAASGLSGFVVDRAGYDVAFIVAGTVSALGLPLLLIGAGGWGSRLRVR